MQTIQRVELLGSPKDLGIFLLIFCGLLLLSLSYRYYRYSQFTQFDSQEIQARVIKQYTKTKQTKQGKTRSYQVLKLISSDGFSFYTTSNKALPNLMNKELQLEIYAGEISFLEYLKGFYARSSIEHIDPTPSVRQKLLDTIAKQHTDPQISAIYGALFLAAPLPYDLQRYFSNLGISHLFAISGFHLGILVGLIFLLFGYPYRWLQNRYFPYRSYNHDRFVFVLVILLGYLLLLHAPPSLLRAYTMLLVGFILYEKGVSIISMQLLLITFLLLIVLWPQLLFNIGFYLSILGVFYIFLFLILFQNHKSWLQALLLPVWLYLMMLPFSAVLFGNFSLYHPLSILLSLTFTIFYPLALLLHILGVGGLLDPLLDMLLKLPLQPITLQLDPAIALGVGLLSLATLKYKRASYLLMFFVSVVFAYLIYKVAEF